MSYGDYLEYLKWRNDHGLPPPGAPSNYNSSSEKRPASRRPATRSTMVRTASSPALNTPEIRKNARLADILNAAQPSPPVIQQYQPPMQPTMTVMQPALMTNNSYYMTSSDAFRPPVNMGQCRYCDEVSPNFGDQKALERHWEQDCKMLTMCRYCGKIVEVPQLTDHFLNRCKFVSGQLKRCSKCGLAREYDEKEKLGVDHPLCRKKLPPPGTQWCPLCAIAVIDTKEYWLKHRTTQGVGSCYDDGYRTGAPEDPSDSNTHRPKTQHGSPQRSVGGKFIDAEKLVAALQSAQLRQKKKKPKVKETVTTEVVDMPAKK